MSVNGKTCWTRTNMLYKRGTRQCGGGHFDEAFRVAGCEAKLSGSGQMPMTVRVWTNLNSSPDDESFGIDNVVIEKIKTALSQRNSGCNLLTTEAACVAAADARTGQSYSGSPCDWCCGIACTKDNSNKCEPHTWLVKHSTYTKRSDNTAG